MVDQLARLQAALIEQYTLERELGHGGMASVYLAQDLKHRRPVALKVLRAELAVALGPERFLREIEIAARLNHPHILPLHDSGAAEGVLYYVMPYVEGESLRGRLLREQQLPLDEAIAIAREVADALSYAHRHDVIHRDIKPENILLSSGHALVADFGIARAITAAGGDRLTQTGVAVGTPGYMSPEQGAGSGQLDGRSDIYGLGCVLYEMLAGEPPFVGGTLQATLAKQLSEPVPHLGVLRDVPATVEQAVTKALARAPADRFPSAAQFAEALAAPALGPLPWKRRAALFWSAGLAVLVVGGVVLASKLKGRVTADSSGTAASVAILDFKNLSRDTTYGYLSDGLTEEIATGLGRVPRLEVKSPSGMRRVERATPDDLRAIGRALGVRYLVEGTVLPSRQRVGVTVRLVRAGDGVLAWSETYSRPVSDLLAIIEDVSRKVAINVAGALLPAERSALAARPTGNTAAYDHFLKGDFYLARRTPRDVARAMQEYQAAVKLDSGFVRARAKTALCYGVFLQWGWDFPGVSPDVVLVRGFTTADLALQQDSTSSDAWLARGYLLSYRYNRTIEGVRAAFERAIALDPRSAEALHADGRLLAELGEDSAAVAMYRRALTLEPDRAITLHHLGRLYEFGHRYQEARRWLDSALAVGPDYGPAYTTRARVRLELGDAAGARVDAETAMRLSQAPWATSSMALVELQAGDTLAARRRVEPLVDQVLASHQAPGFDAWLAIPLVALGERDRALDLLELAPRGPELMWLLRLPTFDALRANPRFQRIVEESRPLAVPK